MLRLILLVGLVFVAFAAFRVATSGPRVPKPGEAGFTAADEAINAHHGAVGFGPDAAATAIADAFAKRMKVEQARSFTGGAQDRKLTLTDDEFLTWCQPTPDGVCLLVHVPQLKNYRDDVRTALGQLAWRVAQETAAPALRPGHDRVQVGLRGAMFYGVIAQGRAGDRLPSVETASSLPRDRFYAAFLPATTPPASVPAAPVPATAR